MSGLIRPKIDLDRACIPVLVTSNFDDDLIKNIRASKDTLFSHYSGPIWPKFKLVRDFMHVLVTCKYKKDQIKINREKVETPFSPLLVNGGFLLTWTPVLIESASKHYAAFPHPQCNDKFDQD